MQNAVGAILGFWRATVFAAKVQLAVNIIFNQYYVVFFQQGNQTRPFSALSVKPSGFWLFVISQQAFTGYSCNACSSAVRSIPSLRRWQSKAPSDVIAPGLQRPVKQGFRQLPNHPFGDCLQAQVEGFHRAGGDDDFIR